MVTRHAVRLATLLAVLCCAGCGLFTVSPFPDFVDKTDIAIDLGSRINGIAAGASPVTYDLNVIDQPGLPPRVLLLVNPPSSDPNAGFDYKGQLIFLDEDLNVLGQGTTASSVDYFSRPYAYAADASSGTGFNVLAGYTVLNASGARQPKAPPPTSLEGFAVTDGTTNYIFSTPAGQYASFDLNYSTFDNTWNILTNPQLQTLPIIPTAARPSTSDPNYANLGYQLVGAVYNSATGDVTFILSEPAQGRIVAARMSLSVATTPPNNTPLLSAAGWPVSASAWPLSVKVDRPELHADINGFFMVQRDSWMTRYSWTPSGALSRVGSVQQIVGDRSLNRHYAFLLPQSGGPQYMYRFDPASRILTRYKRWW